MFLKYKTTKGTNFSTLILKDQAQEYLAAAMSLNNIMDLTFDFCGIIGKYLRALSFLELKIAQKRHFKI